MKALNYFLLILIITGCSTIKVTYDYDKNADFSSFKTFAYTEETADLPLNQLNRDRLIDAVNNEMYLKGFSESEDPDIVVDLHIKTQKQVQATATSSGAAYGPYRYGWRTGYTTTQVDYTEYTDGSLFISFVDMKTEKLVWQGVGTKTIDETASPEQREKNINYAVQQILSKYPPVSN